MSTEAHFQPRKVTPTLQLLPLYMDTVDLCEPSSVLYDLGPQSAVTHAMKRVAYEFRCRKVRFQHPHRLVSECVDGLGSHVRSRV